MKNFAAVIGKLAVPVILLAYALPANAVEITYEGSTSGSFSDATTANYLSFSGVDFGPGTTSGGSATLANLGVFTVTLRPPRSSAIEPTGTFSLDVIFTVPSNASAANPVVATVDGTINSQNANDVWFDFGLGQTINYSGVGGSGSFFFTVNDVIFPNGSQTGAQQTLTGLISNVVFNPIANPTGNSTISLASVSVLEPGSLALLGLGLVGLGLTRRKAA